jgi:hypothetical protein
MFTPAYMGPFAITLVDEAHGTCQLALPTQSSVADVPFRFDQLRLHSSSPPTDMAGDADEVTLCITEREISFGDYIQYQDFNSKADTDQPRARVPFYHECFVDLLPCPTSLRIGDKVWLSTGDAHIARRSKATPTYMGPFAITIVDEARSTCQLALPPQSNVADVPFRFDQLRLHSSPPLRPQTWPSLYHALPPLTAVRTRGSQGWESLRRAVTSGDYSQHQAANSDMAGPDNLDAADPRPFRPPPRPLDPTILHGPTNVPTLFPFRQRSITMKSVASAQDTVELGGAEALPTFSPRGDPVPTSEAHRPRRFSAYTGDPVPTMDILCLHPTSLQIPSLSRQKRDALGSKNGCESIGRIGDEPEVACGAASLCTRGVSGSDKVSYGLEQHETPFWRERDVLGERQGYLAHKTEEEVLVPPPCRGTSPTQYRGTSPTQQCMGTSPILCRGTSPTQRMSYRKKQRELASFKALL